MEKCLADLFTERLRLTLPERYTIRGRVVGNIVRQLAAPSTERDVELDPTAKGYFGEAADLPRLALVRRGIKVPIGDDEVVRIDEVGPISAIPIACAAVSSLDTTGDRRAEDHSSREVRHTDAEIRASSQDTLTLREEHYEGDDSL